MKSFEQQFVEMTDHHRQMIQKSMRRKTKAAPCYWGIITKDGYVEILSMTRDFARGHMRSGERLCRFRVQLDETGQPLRKRR